MDDAYKELATMAAVAARVRFEEAVGQLVNCLQFEEEYSMSARCSVMGFRSSTRPWLDALIAAI